MIAHRSIAWREIATIEDEQRLREWRSDFTAALAAARKAGQSTEIAREGALLEPDAALGGGPIPDGLYRCRIIKLGAKSEGMLDYVSYPPFRCIITASGGLQRFTKTSGSQRVVGLIFPGDAMRQVLLGTLVLGDESRAMQYGEDRMRDVAGYIERIGPEQPRRLFVQSSRAEPAVPDPSDLLRRHQARAFEHLHVLLEAREGHLEVLGELADRGVTAPEALENAAAGGVGEGREGGIEAW
jgi:hypothetical protein